MQVKQIPTGIIINDNEVIAIELTNNKGTYVQIFNYGAIINKFIVKNIKNERQDIVLGFDTFEQYLNADYLANYPYLNTVIGRYANRIKGGEFSIADQDYELERNSGNCTLHGGAEGFDRKLWDIVETDNEVNASVTLQYESVDGEEGFPGDLLVELTFELTDNDELILSYEAETDEDTPINLTHHIYFNLSPNGASVNQHHLQVFAPAYLEQDEDFAVTGKVLPVANTEFDFRTAKEIGKDCNPMEGYDKSFVLNKAYGDLTLASKTSEVESGLMLSVYTTEPVAHIYTGKYLDVKNAKGGKNYEAFDGFCIETQHHPNAVNIPEFPNTVLQPEDLYTQTTIFKVSLIE
ncbi:galactose mutarotase [Pedobacter changchengzhani]|uniref:Aldose 1-epimerase n=1 Tax=Pedobacter changchengzhani TaxID=2529274 RepID=A0A4R5MJ88_9SPHI|nr:aldose epimerase family protein [Pedobacter changchengzhani]TDG35707.1 galactose mutarotase [Pedobacter changchengzhani]